MLSTAVMLLLIAQGSSFAQRAVAADTGAANTRPFHSACDGQRSVEAGSSTTVFGMDTQSAGSVQADNRQRELELARASRAPPSTAHPLNGLQAGAASAICCAYTMHFACCIFHLARYVLHAARSAHDTTGHAACCLRADACCKFPAAMLRVARCTDILPVEGTVRACTFCVACCVACSVT
jgi:hypothetical protein